MMAILIANLLSIELYEQERWMACIEKSILTWAYFWTYHFLSYLYLLRQWKPHSRRSEWGYKIKQFNIKVDWINKCHDYFWSENIWVRVGSMMLLLKIWRDIGRKWVTVLDVDRSSPLMSSKNIYWVDILWQTIS